MTAHVGQLERKMDLFECIKLKIYPVETAAAQQQRLPRCTGQIYRIHCEQGEYEPPLTQRSSGRKTIGGGT